MKEIHAIVTENEILDGFAFEYKGRDYTAVELPEDDGYACGRRTDGKDADLFFVYTGSGNWCFVSAELAIHEEEGGEYDPE
jgi:hypothetical protein